LDDEAQVKKIVPAVLAMALDPAVAKRKAVRAHTFVKKRQGETMAQLRKELARSG